MGAGRDDAPEEVSPPFLTGPLGFSLCTSAKLTVDRCYRAFRFSALDFPRLGSAFSSKATFCPSANP